MAGQLSMSSHLHDFMFDVNYSIGKESVFTLIDQEQIAPFPPIAGILLLSDGTDFLLSDGETLSLV